MSAPILLLDAGNTRLKWAVLEQGTRHDGIADYASLSVPPWPDLPFGRVLGCNVAGPERAAVLAALLPDLAIEWLRSSAKAAGVENGYREPERLGTDRWAALIGARAITHEPTLVAMAGTALTVDALDGNGRFLGGVIVPGYRLMRESLARGTADLGHPDGERTAFPRSTGEAIVNGAEVALVGAVLVMHDRLTAVAGGTPGLLLSGGDAPRLLTLLSSVLAGKVRHVDNLVLAGLARLAVEISEDTAR
ncbi:type III pantothenate kinase [Chitinimonas lacunae]|uniref:Type III pantothenate kinase n=1 Tax=Chitinimonas lacunae TaxID=1963018 RepID=A0ABV8MQF4_9NEIS